MATYTTIDKITLPTYLDELGLKYSLPRLTDSDESLDDYRRRLLLEARDPSGASEADLIRSTSRKVGFFEEEVMKIDLILDGNGDPVAADPFLEITASYLRAYSDYAAGTVDVEVDFTDKSDGYFIQDVNAAFASSTFFSVSDYDTSYDEKWSELLRFSNSQKLKRITRLEKKYMNSLDCNYVRSYTFSDDIAFVNEQASTAALTADGDYYVDTTNGVVFSYTIQSGFATISYQDFPFSVRYSPVRLSPMIESDARHLAFDTVLGDVGTSEQSIPNSRGAYLYNQIFKAHSTGWGN
jgi:hypothetical protein